MAADAGKDGDLQGGVSFVVSFNESSTKQGKLPKGLAARRQQRQAKASLTGETIAEKQKKAEERRQKLKEEKLERLHQLEEEMAGLARKIQAHEEAKKSANPHSNSSPSSTSHHHHQFKIDTRSQRQCDVDIRVPNGVIHSPK